MLPTNNLLTRAISSLCPTAELPPNPQPIESPKPDSPLIFLSADFILTEDEDDLLKRMIHESKLTPNLTLFDLLFFDLRKELDSLQKFVQRVDFDREVETLENCYASLIQSKNKDTSRLKDFLANLIRNFIFSNHDLNKSVDESIRSVKAAGDTKLIIDTLFKRVQLFKKFEETPACHPQLFCSPLSKLVGNERCVAKTVVEFKTIFKNNSLFLMSVFNSQSKADPNLNDLRSMATSICRIVKSFGSLNSDANCFLKMEMTLVQIAKVPLIYNEIAPHLIKVIGESFRIYKRIFEDNWKAFKSRETQQTELILQTTGQILELSTESFDPDDLLAAFRADKLIEPSFKLTPTESALMQELFRYPLDSEITLLDLLIFAFYDKLGQLSGIIPCINAEITKTQDSITSHCLLLYVGLCRSIPENLQILGATNGFSERFSHSPRSFLRWINTIFDNFQQGVKNTKVDSRNPTPNQKKALETNQNKILEQFTTTVLPLRNLLTKLLKSKSHFDLLLRSASKYQGSNTLDQDRSSARATLKHYWDCLKNGFQSGIKSGLIGITCQFDQIMQNDLPFSPRPLEKERTSFGAKIISAIFGASKATKINQKNLVEAILGRLDHPTWLAEKKLAATSPKNQQEFIEQLFSQTALMRIQPLILSDILRLVEKRVFTPGTLTTKSCFLRLQHNMFKTVKSPDHHSSPLLPNTIPPKFKAVLDPISIVFTQQQELFNYALTSEDVQHGDFNYPRWLEFLFPIETIISSRLTHSLQALAALKVELLEDLRNAWSDLTLEQLHSLDISGVQEAIFQEGLQLLRPLLVLSDMLALLQKRHFSEEAAIIPPELADIMALDGIDETLQDLIKAKTPLPPPSPQPVRIEKPKPTPNTVQKAPVVQKQKPAAVKREACPRRHTPAPTTPLIPEVPSEIRELKQLTKSREVLKKLKALGFFEDRQTGSHHILRGPQSGMVVVPNNNNLPLGTRRSIADQAANALNNGP